MRVLPHSLKRLLRRYNGEFGAIVTGRELLVKATRVGKGRGGSSTSFSWSGSSEGRRYSIGGWGWIAMDRGIALGCRWRGLLILGPIAVPPLPVVGCC